MADIVFHTKTRDSGGVRPLSSVLKTLRVLDVLGAQPKVMRAVEVAQATGMSRATAHQKLVTLVHAGWVEQTKDGAYRLSLHASRIGNAALMQASLGERVLPFLQELVVETGETASLAVIDGTNACIVQRVESNGILRAELRIGSLLDLEHSASGRILVAFASPALLEQLRRSGAALPDPKLLAQVRRENFAPSSGKSFAGVRAVAAPIFDAGGACIAALSLVGPVPRFTVERNRAPICRSADAINAFIRGQPA
jgi:IclR family transcriptional regulator, KDG regulon repressor